MWNPLELDEQQEPEEENVDDDAGGEDDVCGWMEQEVSDKEKEVDEDVGNLLM